MEYRYQVGVVRKGESKPVLCVFTADYDNAGRAADIFFKAYPDHMVVIHDCEGLDPDEFLVEMPGISTRSRDCTGSTSPLATRELVGLSLPG